jgi:hypothetical protein
MRNAEDKPQLRSLLDGSGGPKLSVVVIVYNIRREVPRTLLSLSASYQRDIAPGDYEVIVVDNGSDPALDPEMVASFGGNFRLIRVAPAPSSPAHALLSGRPLGVAFIDGLHLYEQALRDFINLERYCGPRSVILFHDTVPLDEATQSRALDTKFNTGDVWKVVLCLKHYRPDLDVFTIAAPWTGLTVVAGLDRASRVLADRYDEAVARFFEAPFADIQDRLDSALNIVSNDWNVVAGRLKARGIL